MVALCPRRSAYRAALSPLMPNSCRFTPSCSPMRWTRCINTVPSKACGLTARRLARCHPITWLGGSSGSILFLSSKTPQHETITRTSFSPSRWRQRCCSFGNIRRHAVDEGRAVRQAALSHQEKTKPSAAGAPVLPVSPRAMPFEPRGGAEGGRQARGDRHAMVDGSSLLKGARLDDLRLKTYHETVDPKAGRSCCWPPRARTFPYANSAGSAHLICRATTANGARRVTHPVAGPIR